MKIIPFLRTSEIFANLAEEELAEIAELATIRHYPKKSNLFLQHDPIDRFFIVIDGWVKLFHNTFDGDETVIALMGPGDFFGDVFVTDKFGYPSNAGAIERSSVVEIPMNTLKKIVKKSPDFSLALLQSLSHSVQRLQLENEHLTVMDAKQRVACYLQQLFFNTNGLSHHNSEKNTLNLPMDKQLLASRLGMKPETFSRSLKALEEYGVSANNGQISINDSKHLEHLCCSHCSISPQNCIKMNRFVNHCYLQKT
ncbi:Crp/Fnr family transcriptional regulator [Emcibacter sp.]|uniref:Crp/Fnr family transcriptional regulator n=1 Tax=Emcibacter sp. TaxID=1979954 RepID=UPI002AA6A4BA|nr:Crp/Fnr family transcriptional regulator [Emcibacter sp.]